MPRLRATPLRHDDIPDHRIPKPTAEEIQMMTRYLNRAFEIIGGQGEAARKLGIQSQAITQWDVCPPLRARPIEYLTKRRVTRYQLRPDVFGDGSDV